MVLRKINIFGFKSFADKTELHFGKGMTAVIGPNGCGKSNVVDAIRWVFGEQRASTLRSSNMQDVIFSGTEKRHPLNMAEVTLTISNNKGILPIEYNEVAITRRIFRNGDSEYLINKNPSRLKDIHNLFLDTGIGSNAYTTIENSMINRILSDKNDERRILFEEAAGIGKYKQKIRESQRKLERTRQDMLRVNDRIQEKDRYVRILSRQVEKARRYQRYQQDLQTLEVGLENKNYKFFIENLDKLGLEHNDVTQESEKVKTTIATIESKIEKMSLNKTEKEDELQKASKNVGEIKEKINFSDREISVSNQSVAILKQNIGRFHQEIETLDKQQKEKQEFLEKIEASIVSRQSQLENHVTDVEAANQELEDFDVRVLSQKEKVDELAVQQLNLVQSTGEKQRELSNCQTNLSNCIDQCDRDKLEIKRLEDNIEEYQTSLVNCKEKFKQAKISFERHTQSREKLVAIIDKEDDRYHSLVEREKHLEAQIDSSKSKLSFLEGLNSSFEGYNQGVKRLLKKKLPGTMGIVADLIEVKTPEMINQVDRALGDAVQTVVFKNNENLKQAINYLNEEKAGIARMISMENLEQLNQKMVTDQMHLDQNSGKASSMRIHITTVKECEDLADHLFNRILTCQSCDSALEYREQIAPDSRVIAPDGTICYGDGTVVAGGKVEELPGILHRKMEIEKLKTDIDKFFTSYNEVMREKEICIMTRDEAKIALVEVDEKLNRGRQLQQEQETTIRHYENEIDNLQERISILTPELIKNEENIKKHQNLIKEYESALAGMNNYKDELENTMKRAKDKLMEMDSERARLADHLKNIELSHQGLSNRVEQDRKSIVHLQKDIQTLANGKQKKSHDIDATGAEIKQLNEKLSSLKEALRQQQSHLQDSHQVLESIREEYNGILQLIDGDRRSLKALQSNLEVLLDKKHSLEVEQTREQEKKRAIREKIFSAYEIDLESPPEEIPWLEQEDEEAINTINILKERLRRIGDVNLSAIAEYDKESSELKEMVLQRDDLQTAVDDLERAIKKLNHEARERFVRTFEQVEKNLREMFTTLFEGGEVSLTLEENVDPLQAEILINVRPAGKKMRGVTLLSGGERALTSISLLFALYLVKPSAYCILDELDAPLDDANIDRFLKVLKKFAEKTQFIIITHNKHTMEAADILYGVTQQESGISTIASVKLGEDIHLQAA